MSYNTWSTKTKAWYILYLCTAAPLPESRRFKPAKKLRNFFARQICASIHKTANIEKNAHFNPAISVGARSSVGVNCELDGPVTIGENVMMGPEVVIMARSHKHSETDTPMIDQRYEPYKPVTIEDDCWIGRRAIILPGVTIAKGCII